MALTMAIEQNRIEAAARAMWFEYCCSLGWPNGQPTWDEIKAWDRSKVPDTAVGVLAMLNHVALIYDQAEAALRAAYPELASDPPTGWVAPWEASDWMVQNGAVEIAGIDMGMYDGNWKHVRECMAEAYRAARDAHLKEQGHE